MIMTLKALFSFVVSQSICQIFVAFLDPDVLELVVVDIVSLPTHTMVARLSRSALMQVLVPKIHFMSKILNELDRQFCVQGSDLVLKLNSLPTHATTMQKRWV